MIFSRNPRNLWHSQIPGVEVGRYEHGLKAIWAWRECAHLLVIERQDYGAGENLVRLIARKFKGERVQLDPKEYLFRNHRPWMFMTTAGCATQVARLNLIALERAAQIEQGADLAPILVTVPELHDILEGATLPANWDESEAGKSLLYGLQRLLVVGRAGRVYVLANLRQGYFYKRYLPPGLLNQFSGHLVLGRTGKSVTEQLELPRVFDRPHGRLGDLTDSFWPLKTRIR